VESRRKQDAIELQKKYKLIGPLITKVEGLVYNTNSSQSPKMKAYYSYWERQIFSTLSEVNSQHQKKKIFLLILFSLFWQIYNHYTIC
jgi:hypothetical protein